MRIINDTNLKCKMIQRRMFFSALFILIGICLGSLPVYAQQEQMYSQYMFNMLHINPAYAGKRGADNLTMLYRKQWVNISGAPETFTLSWDGRFRETNIGYGLEVYNDRLGVEKTTGVQGYYSYLLPFENSNLSLGLSAGLLYDVEDYTDVNAYNVNDPQFLENTSAYLPQAGIGMLYTHQNFYAGLSVPALFKTQATTTSALSNLAGNNHYFLTGGYIFTLSDDVKLKPSVLVKGVKGSSLQYDFNLNTWIADMICLGLSYRTKDAIVMMFEIAPIDRLKLGYAYDYTLSRLGVYSRGSHEILLRYEFNKSKGKHHIISPRFCYY